MISYGNRGMAFENLVEMTNKQYFNQGAAVIQKIATPVKVTKIDRAGRIRDGWYEKKSTVDFIGTANGRGIAFDAKSTQERTRFNLDNVSDHQVTFLKKYHDQGGISFLLVQFAKHHQVYVLPFHKFFEWWENAMVGGRKSIPHDWFVENCDTVKSKNGYVLHYLDVIFKDKVS